MKQKVFKTAGFALLGAAALFLAPALLHAQAETPKGPHGAATDAFQIQALTELQESDTTRGEVPLGVDLEYWNSLIPADNRPTEDAEVNVMRIALGEKLYFDPRLSEDGTVSCATCHDVTRGFGDALPTSEGIDKDGKKQFGTRNAPTTMNVALLHTMFWDGRSPSVEHQAMQPIVNPVEMGMPVEESRIIRDIKDDADYKEMFKKAYNAEVNYKNIGDAIAAFERTLVFMDNPFFEFLAASAGKSFPAKVEGFDRDAYAGWVLFNREGRCNSCHQISPSNLLGSDNKFHNIGVSAHRQNFESLAAQALEALDKDASDAALDELALTTDMGELGRFIVTKNPADIGAFRTPMLLNVGVTGPYMHDGSFQTLWDVIDQYNKGGVPNHYLDGGIEPLNLTEKQVDQLVAFLFSLTDKRLAAQNQAEYQRQRKIADENRPERDENAASRKSLSFENYKPGLEVKGAAQ